MPDIIPDLAHNKTLQYIIAWAVLMAIWYVWRAVRRLRRRRDGRHFMPLRAVFENGQLTLSIGIGTLTFAFENSEDNNPFNDSSGDIERQVQIGDPLQFAKDVCHEINRESEDGSTPLTRFLDSMMNEAVNQGSLAIMDPDDGSPTETKTNG